MRSSELVERTEVVPSSVSGSVQCSVRVSEDDVAQKEQGQPSDTMVKEIVRASLPVGS